MVSALIEELKTVATEAKRSQIEDTVGSSWAALAMEEGPQGRRIGTLLVEAGAGGAGWKKGREGERAGGRGGGVGAGVLYSENNGKIRWQPSLIDHPCRSQEIPPSISDKKNQTSLYPLLLRLGRQHKHIQ